MLAAACVILGVIGVGPQQVVFPLAFAVYAVVVRRVPVSCTALPRGSVAALWTAASSFLLGGIAAISGTALLAWHEIARPDLQDLVRTFVPNLPIWLLVPGRWWCLRC